MQINCARCGASLSIDKPDLLLATAVCMKCGVLPEVSAFVEAERNWHRQEQERANAARKRFEQRKLRLEREEQQRILKLSARGHEAPSSEPTLPDHILAALQRARSRQHNKS